MKFKIHIDNAEHEIEAGADGTLTLDGQTFQGKVSSPSDDRRTVQVRDGSYEVRVIENCADTGMFILELAGERIPVTVTDVAKGTGGGGAAAAGGVAATGVGGANGAVPAAVGAAEAGASAGAESPAATPDVKEGIWAPVPGKIVDVFVKTGGTVEEGAAVLVLEAMKMENELHAPKKGTVTAVLVKKGDQAEKGQLLVALE